ncbi:hypothetical protein SAMN05444266_103396 [Chitinophaga jiangningensis]|uniref:Uncharacterized protein n=1 Tax=Chitinophaga jiangningensis TaxID=1419482 RepID=A0A1M7ASN5_9BACT|nr:hypothetical protein [Chitinophaga jiangningensis]SHL45768.1 hypothetical protein SAMN05444266_103396 [Chitinophaga jiangningensis]
MNRLHYCLVSLFAVALFACSNDPEVKPIIPISAYNVSVWAGKDTSLTILDTAVTGLKLTNSNETLATAKLEGRKILISGLIEGAVTLTLSAVGDERQGGVTVKVLGLQGGGGWRRVDRNDKFPLTITVQATDAAFAEQLKKQLTDEVLGKVTEGPAYLVFNGTSSGKFMEARGSKPTREGNFTFQQLKLTLNPGTTPELYTIVPQSPTTIKMVRDRTAEFIAANPDKGIQLVKIESFWGKISTPG